MITAENWPEHLLVFNKPDGLPTLPGKSGQDSALTRAIQKFPEIKKIQGHRSGEYGLLHRLDTGTSGLLLFARSQVAFDEAHEWFAQKKIKKIYRAIVEGPIEDLPSHIDFPIGNSAKTRTKVIVLNRPDRQKQIRGQAYPAHTEILSRRPLSNRKCDIEILITTGVRHQIRAHLAAVGFPILGDPRYQGAPASRLWLHAWKVVLPVPCVGSSSGENLLNLECPIPSDWPR